jgi:hypothetical protein
MKRTWREDRPDHWTCPCDTFLLTVDGRRDGFVWSVFDTEEPEMLPRESGFSPILDGAKLAAERTARRLGNE